LGKIGGFDMNTRYKEIYRTPENLYLHNSPLLIEAAALYVDVVENKEFVLVKLNNISDNCIISCNIDIYVYDEADNKLQVKEHLYRNRCILTGDSFGGDELVYLQISNGKKIKIDVKQVTMQSGETWESNSGNWGPVPDEILAKRREQIEIKVKREELQRKRDALKEPQELYIPPTEDNSSKRSAIKIIGVIVAVLIVIFICVKVFDKAPKTIEDATSMANDCVREWNQKGWQCYMAYDEDKDEYVVAIKLDVESSDADSDTKVSLLENDIVDTDIYSDLEYCFKRFDEVEVNIYIAYSNGKYCEKYTNGKFEELEPVIGTWTYSGVYCDGSTYTGIKGVDLDSEMVVYVDGTYKEVLEYNENKYEYEGTWDKKEEDGYIYYYFDDLGYVSYFEYEDGTEVVSWSIEDLSSYDGMMMFNERK
jgi:hypothetical protein